MEAAPCQSKNYGVSIQAEQILAGYRLDRVKAIEGTAGFNSYLNASIGLDSLARVRRWMRLARKSTETSNVLGDVHP